MKDGSHKGAVRADAGAQIAQIGECRCEQALLLIGRAKRRGKAGSQNQLLTRYIRDQALKHVRNFFHASATHAPGKPIYEQQVEVR